MKIAAAVTVLVVLTSVSRAQQPVPIQGGDFAPPAISLFVSCDLTREFVTPGLDEREVLWMGTPVSREGARALEESRRICVVTRVPLVLEANLTPRVDAPVAPIDFSSRSAGGHMRLISASNALYGSAKSGAPPDRSGMSTWAHILGLYGR